MRNLLKRLPKKLAAVGMALVVMTSLTSTAFAAFGPAGRPTMAWSPSSNGADHVVFNSFTGVPNGIGDERDFFRGVQVGRDSTWSDPVKNVTQDAEVEGKIYIHNNADPLLNDKPGNPGVAKNVTVRVAMPTGTQQTQDATAYISADNANPGTIFDTLTMTGANSGNFSLEYEAGSAQLHQGSTTTPLSDALVTTGVNIGDQKGCFDYVREVTFKMKVKMPEYTIQKKVRFEGQTSSDWKESLDAKVGQTVEWKVEFDNVGRTQLHNVVLLDQVPANVSVVPGSVKLIDGNHPNGYVYPDTAVQNNGTQVNVNIGNVNAGINAILEFKTKVNDTDALKCKTSTLVNTAYATPEGFSPIHDSAQIVVNQPACQPTTPSGTLPNTGAGDVIGLFSVVTVAGALLHRFVLSRRYS